MAPLESPVTLETSFAKKKKVMMGKVNARIHDERCSPDSLKHVSNDLVSTLKPELLPRQTALELNKRKRSTPKLTIFSKYGSAGKYKVIHDDDLDDSSTSCRGNIAEEAPPGGELADLGSVSFEEFQSHETAPPFNRDGVRDYEMYKNAVVSSIAAPAVVSSKSASITSTPPRKIVGKGRKKTDCDSYDPEDLDC